MPNEAVLEQIELIQSVDDGRDPADPLELRLTRAMRTLVNTQRSTPATVAFGRMSVYAPQTTI